MTDYTSFVYQNLHRFHEKVFLPFDNPTFANPPFEDAPYRVLIVRLSPFRDVDRSTPHLFLFQEVRRALPNAFVDMAFFPASVERELFDQEGIPYLLGVQSLHLAHDFDLILISNAYTLELINLPYLLLRSGFPLFSSERGEEWPILILGGSNALATQSIVTSEGDSLVDAIFFGEGERWVGGLARLLESKQGDKRATLDKAATQVEGLWVAGSWRPIVKAVLCDPEAHLLPVEYPLLNTPSAHEANLQITYGCPAFCTFCFEGYDRKPYRELPLSDLLDAARQVKRAQGNEEINLYSFNFSTHSDILDMLLALHQFFDRVGLKSQRADTLQRVGYLLEAELQADKRSFTLGIEGVSERQRAWLHKSLPTPDLEALLQRLFQLKIRDLKLFYLLTGHETDQDVTEFREFVRQLKAIHRSGNRGIRVVFSFGLLIRMPFTPLQYDRLYLEEEAWRHLIGPVKSACETNGFEFRLAFDWQTYCVTQVLALGGYWLTEPVVALAREGHYFDQALPDGYWDALRGWMVEHGRWNEAFLGEKGPDYPFPLAFVRSAIPSDFIYRQYQEAKAGVDSGYCLGIQDERGTCLNCGACADAQARRAIVQHQVRTPGAAPYMEALRRTVRRKRRLKPAYFLVQLEPWLARVLPEFWNAYLLRGILRRHPELAENLLSVRESLFAARSLEGRFPSVHGETVFAFKAWDAAAVGETLAAGDGLAGDGFRILGPAEGFEPGTFEQLHLDLRLPASHFPQPRRALEAYLHDAYVPYSLRRDRSRTAEGRRYDFEVPAKGIKKKAVLDGFFEIDEGGFRASLDVGYKFDLRAFLDAFGGRDLSSLAWAQVSDLRW